MTHDIKQLSMQSLKALLALRTDAVFDITKELEQLIRECEELQIEIARRGE